MFIPILPVNPLATIVAELNVYIVPTLLISELTILEVPLNIGTNPLVPLPLIPGVADDNAYEAVYAYDPLLENAE